MKKINSISHNWIKSKSCCISIESRIISVNIRLILFADIVGVSAFVLSAYPLYHFETYKLFKMIYGCNLSSFPNTYRYISYLILSMLEIIFLTKSSLQKLYFDNIRVTYHFHKVQSSSNFIQHFELSGQKIKPHLQLQHSTSHVYGRVVTISRTTRNGPSFQCGFCKGT